MIKIIIGAYGALSIIASIAQVKVKNIPKASGVVMLIGGMLMLTSIILSSNFSLFMLIVGMLMAHISSTINGYKMYGFINKKYNMLRLIFSILLIVFYISQ